MSPPPPPPLPTYHFGFEGRLDLSVLQAFPVDASEEDVVSDVPLPVLTAAQTLGGELGHQLLRMRDKDEKSVKTASVCNDKPLTAAAAEPVIQPVLLGAARRSGGCSLKAQLIMKHI